MDYEDLLLKRRDELIAIRDRLEDAIARLPLSSDLRTLLWDVKLMAEKATDEYSAF